MANKLYEETDIQNIANAIREKTGTADTFKVFEMANAISNIRTNGTVIVGDAFTYQLIDTVTVESDYIDVSKLTWYQGNKYGKEGDSIDDFISNSAETRIYSELFPITKGLIINNSDKKIGINLFDANKICIKRETTGYYSFNGTDLNSFIGDNSKKLAYMYFQMVNSDDTTPISPSDVPSNLVII